MFVEPMRNQNPCVYFMLFMYGICIIYLLIEMWHIKNQLTIN